MIVTLSFNAPELLANLKEQVPAVQVVDVCSVPPIEGAMIRLEENRYWVGNWHIALTWIKENRPEVKWVWMLNDDISWVTPAMYFSLRNLAALGNAFMVTPRFNSPHAIFRESGQGFCTRVPWVDMTAPLIDINKYFELGGFDLQFNGYFADIDLCYRARMEGFRMFRCNNYEIHHIGGYTTNKMGTAHIQSNHQDNEILVHKYGKGWQDLINF